MYQDSYFGTMPLQFKRLRALIAPKLLDWTCDSRYHDLHFCENTDGNGQKLMEKRLGEV